MEPRQVLNDLQTFWMWIVAPLALAASLFVAVRLRAPQLLKLGEAFRGLRAHDADAPGELRPWVSVMLSIAGTYGAAGAVGAATAVALGGAGAIAWVWLFAILLAPLRMAEAVLARTAAPGKAGEVPGSLAGRLLQDRAGFVQALGILLLILVPVAAFLFYGGTHGEAVVGAGDLLVRHAGMWIALAVAVLGALVALAPMKRTGPVLGWIAVAAIFVVFGAAVLGLTSAPLQALRGLARAISEAMHGSEAFGAFSGATAGEIATAAMLHALPPVAAVGGVDGAVQSEARGATKRHAAAALLGPLAYGLLTTLLGLSFVATGAFSRREPDARRINDLTAYNVGAEFESASQRNEADRRYTGPLRVEDGDTGIVRIAMATERGVADIFYVNPVDKGQPPHSGQRWLTKRPVHATWFDGRRPADLILRFEDGHVVDLQKRGAFGAFERHPLSELSRLTVHAPMLPSGARLVAASAARSGGSVVRALTLGAVLVLAVLGAAAWGLGVSRTLRAKIPAPIARFTAVIPALGIALAAFGVVPGLALYGTFAAGLLATATSIALLARAKQVADLLR